MHTKRNLRTAALLSLVMVAAVASCGSDSNGPTNSADSITEGSDASGATIDMSAVETHPDLSQHHVDGTIDYPQSPPVGGDHNARWQNCGVYDEPVPNEKVVHSLEHGAVWLAYNPSLSAADVDVLRAYARGQTYVLVSPYGDLAADEAVVATAWGVQLRLDSVDDPRLAVFVATYREGPQTPEPGAPCTGADGEPIE